MKTIKNYLKIVCCSLAIASSSYSCNKSSPSVPDLTISDVNPGHGGVGITVTINGTGFNASPAGNSVFFNGKRATIIDASSSRLSVAVPSLAGSGNISLTTNGNTIVGPMFTYDSSYTASTFATGLNNPQFLTRDANGILYVTNFGDGTVSKISSTGVVSTFVSGLNGTTGITIDVNGSLYVATNNNLNLSTIIKIDPTGFITPFASITGYIYDLAMDKDGNIYAANAGNGTIHKITTSGTVTTLTSGLGNVCGLAISNNNIYATRSDGSVFKIMTTGTVDLVHKFSFGFGGPNKIVADKSENLYLTIYSSGTLSQSNSVTKISSQGVVSTLLNGFNDPCGIIMDISGNFYVVNSQGNSVSKVTVQ